MRTGEPAQKIVNDTARRKLLMALTPDQEAKLRQNGATPQLIATLRLPELLATPQELQAYVARHQAQAQTQLARQTVDAKSTPAPAQAVILPDHFTEWLDLAKSAPVRSLTAADGYSLAQLAEAKAKARAERKPMGFIVVSSKCFGQAYSTRQVGTYAAMAHFYEAFKDPLVLVFVPQESVNETPPAVKKGLTGADAGNLAPNMAIVDATASELIVEVPCGGPKADGALRDKIFTAAAACVQQWLGYHPAANAGP